MATVIIRRLYNRTSKNIRFYYNLSSTTSSTILINRSRKYIYRVYPERKLLLPSTHVLCQSYSDSKKIKKKDEIPKLTLFQKFKEMYRDYWYVLVPVHVITSIGWFSGFYYLAKSGVDIVALFETIHVSDVITNTLRDSTLGHVATAYALYKIFTPLRYMVTLGGTTISINYLKNWGYIKPVPTAQELKSMYTEKRDNLIESVKGKTDDFKFKTEQFKEKKHELIEDLEKRIKLKIEDSKEQIKEKKKDLLDEFRKPLKIKSKD